MNGMKKRQCYYCWSSNSLLLFSKKKKYPFQKISRLIITVPSLLTVVIVIIIVYLYYDTTGSNSTIVFDYYNNDALLQQPLHASKSSLSADYNPIIKIHNNNLERNQQQQQQQQQQYDSLLLSLERQLLESFDPKLESMWTCNNDNNNDNDQQQTTTISNNTNNNKSKLIFVHVFKTAGSTLRRILVEYVRKCNTNNNNKGIALIGHCSNIDYKRLHNNNNNNTNNNIPWICTDNTKCYIEGALSNNGIILTNENNLTTNFIINNNINIIGGHIPLGIGNEIIWNNNNDYYDNNNNNNIQYITFVRQPIEKYISGILYVNRKKNWTLNEIVEYIQHDVINNLINKNKYKDSYSTYLLTPYQKTITDITISIESRIKTIIQNLVSMPILIGIVENMKTSMEMLSYLIDTNRNVDYILHKAADNDGDNNDSNNNNNNNNNDTNNNNAIRFVLNKSTKIPTKLVIDSLKEDRIFYKQLQEYLKYDTRVYEFALKLHQLQYQYYYLQQ